MLSQFNSGNGYSLSFDTTVEDCVSDSCSTGFYLNHGSDVGTGCKAFTSYNYTWVSGTSYSPGSVAVYSGTTYFCISAVSGSTAPGSDPAHWEAVSATSPQATGYGYYWDTNAGEHTWSAVDAQDNSTGDYYFKGPDTGAVSVTGSSLRRNNQGQPSFDTSNPNYYASVTFDGVSGVTAIVNAGALGSGNTNGLLCTELNSPGSNTLIATTDGSATTLFHGGTPSFALVDGTCYNLAGLAANVRTVTTTATAAVTDFLIQGDATAGFFVLDAARRPPGRSIS